MGIDPRFDPRFQRGYDPERHDRPARGTDSERPLFSSSLKNPTGGIGVGTPGVLPPARDRPAPDAGRPVVDETEADADLDADADAEDADAATHPGPDRRNPFLIALWVVSAVLVVAGAWFIVQAASTPTSRFVPSLTAGDIFIQTAWTVAPTAVGVGLAAMVALTLFHALHWRGRERATR
ncbi:hypothetical protein WDJ51_11465 [Rathayibacter sp. YIM 133350]|uniref:hypothetical protein n=1 Tax=Rathayibacter sp. YIM 133350 TaxID=3131992 RepID=UPI00307DDBBC